MLQIVVSLIDDSRGIIYDRNIFYNTGHWTEPQLCMFVPFISTKQPNLKLKTWPKQLLGSLL